MCKKIMLIYISGSNYRRILFAHYLSFRHHMFELLKKNMELVLCVLTVVLVSSERNRSSAVRFT